MTAKTETGKMTQEMIDQFLANPLLARIATSDLETHQPHVVPVWYTWEDGSLWISSFTSTRKVQELQANPRCSIAVDEAQSGYSHQAVVMEGRVELLTEPRELVHKMSTTIYTRYLGEQGVLDPDPQSWIHDPENLLIRLKPEKILAWYSREV
jgi:nitroimidazol reductase NimA-like FMN-containing flavoprotein (pyridoxamine 5'-phosphate oxidase superfamily)